MASVKQVAGNRANSRLSTGPGKDALARTRYNGLKTGIRFRGEFLPWERPEEYQQRVDFWNRSLKPRNGAERELVLKYVRAEWVHARAERAQGERIYTQNAQAPDHEDASVEKDLRRLYWDRQGHLCTYALSNVADGVVQTSWSPEIDDPNEPSVVLRRLESSAKGCQSLIGQWQALADRVKKGLEWQPQDRLKSCRLMGRQPLDILEDDRVLLVYVASYALGGPNGRDNAYDDLKCELGTVDHKKFLERIRSRSPMPPLSATDTPGAHRALLDLVARNVERLEAKLEVHLERADEYAELASDRLGYEESPEAERLRRHEMACHRRMYRCLDAFWKYRRENKDVEDDCEGLEAGALEAGVETENVTTEANLEAGGGEESGAVAVENKNVTTEANLETRVTEVGARGLLKRRLGR